MRCGVDAHWNEGDIVLREGGAMKSTYQRAGNVALCCSVVLELLLTTHET